MQWCNENAILLYTDNGPAHSCTHENRKQIDEHESMSMPYAYAAFRVMGHSLVVAIRVGPDVTLRSAAVCNNRSGRR